MHALDDPVTASLRGPHAAFARRSGAALGYRPEVARFVGWDAGARDPWSDLRDLLGTGGVGLLVGADAPPDGWRVPFRAPGVQMVAEGETGEPDPEAVPLGLDDVPEMSALVDLTRPGPWEARTVELGGYLGLRDGHGRLTAMAGERMRPDGYGEISAVCTHPDARGRGLAARLVRAVAAGIVARGDLPFLHVAGANTGAIRIYERLGFAVRMPTSFTMVVAPAR